MTRDDLRPRTPLPLHGAYEAIDAAWADAARRLKPVLKKSGSSLSTDAAIVSRVAGGLVTHAPTRLRKSIQVAELYERPHVVAALMTTWPLIDKLTETVVEPGVYTVSLRPIGHDCFAFDLHDVDGKRVLASHAEPKPGPPLPSNTIFRIFGVDVERPTIDETLNPYRPGICLSFCGWRICFDIPKRISGD